MESTPLPVLAPSLPVNGEEKDADPNGNAQSLSLFEKHLLAELGEEAYKAGQGNKDAVEDPATLPLEQRLKSSKPDFRAHAYAECARLFSELPSETYATYASQLGTWLSDRHPGAQKEALNAVKTVFTRVPAATAASLWEELLPVFFEKCLNQPRLLALCVDCFADVLALIEKDAFQSPVYALLDKFLDKKGNAAVRGPSAKQMSGLMGALEKLLMAFGAMTFDLQTLVPKVVKYALSTENTVKQAAYNLLQEVYVWTKSVELVTMGLGEKQQAELTRRCEALQGETRSPTRQLNRKQQKRAGRKTNTAQDATAERSASPPPQFDLYDALPEIDITKELVPEKWEKSITKAEKWKHKQEAYDSLAQKAKRLKPGDYGVYVATALASIQSEGNLVVVISAIKALAQLAKALRQGYLPWARQSFTMAMSKLGDRSKPVVLAVQSLLDALLYASSFDTYIDDVGKAIGDKNPVCRQHGLELCLKSLSHPGQSDAGGRCWQKFLSFALATIDDPAVTVRNLAAQILCWLLEGKRAEAVKRAVDALPGKKKLTAEEVIARIQQPATEHGAAKTVKSTTSPRGMTVDKKLSEIIRPVTPPSKGLRPGGQKAMRGPSRTQSSTTTSTTRPESQKEEPLTEVSLDPVAAETLMAETLGPQFDEFVAGLQDKAWPERVKTLQALGTWLSEHSRGVSSRVEALVVWIREAAAKNFKESNVNVMKAVVDVVITLPSIAPETFSKPCMVTFIKGYLEKIADAKLGHAVRDMLLTFAEHTSPRFICAAMFAFVAPLANTKAHQKVCELCYDITLLFGVYELDLVKVVEYGKQAIEKRNPALRASAVKLLGLLYCCNAQVVLGCLGSDVKPALLEDIKASCTKSTAEVALADPERKCRESAGLSQRKAKDVESCDNLGPSEVTALGTTSAGPSARIVVKDLVAPSLLKNLADPKWKTRKDTLIRIQELIVVDGRRHLAPQGLGDLLTALKTRIQQDPNRPTVREALVVVTELAGALGPSGARQYARSILPIVFQKFSDKTPQIRESCLSATSAWLTAIGFTLWLSCLLGSQALNSMGEEREALVTLVTSLGAETFEEATTTLEGKSLLETLIALFLDFLQDKSKIVRTHAETFLLQVAPLVSASLFQRAVKASRTAASSPVSPPLRTLVSQCLTLTKPTDDTRDHVSLGVSGQLTSPYTPRESFQIAHSSALDGFSLKLGSLPTAIDRLQQCRGAEWYPMAYPEDVNTLAAVWKYFTNDALHTAMFSQGHPSDRAVRALDFWIDLVARPEKLSELAPLETPEQHLLDILIKWIVSRILSPQEALAMAALRCLQTLRKTISGGFPTESPVHQLCVQGLLELGIPNILERLTTHDETLTRALHETLRELTTLGHPAATFVILMRSMGSRHSRVVTAAVEEITVLFTSHGAHICQHLDRDLAKITSTLRSSRDEHLQMACLRALAALYPSVGEKVMTACRQANVEDRFLAHLAEHPLLQTQSGVAETSVTTHGPAGTDADGVPEALPDCNVPLVTNALGLNDYEQAFNNLRSSLQAEELLAETRDQLNLYARDVEEKEDILFAQDLAEECRRISEGRDLPNESDVAYWNGIVRLKESGQALGHSLRLIEEIQKLSRQDPVSISEGCRRILVLLDQTTVASGALQSAVFDDDSKDNMTSKSFDWQAIFASEIVTGVTSALAYCFDAHRLTRSESDRNMLCAAGQDVTLLINRIVKNKKALHRASPLQLADLFRHLLAAMSSHTYWSGCPQEEVMVKRLNSIVASHFMGVVSPRNACNLAILVIEFLLDDRDHLNVGLVLRVHRKLIRKLNSKHHVVLNEQEKQYYLRMLDAAIYALKRVESHPEFFGVPVMVELPPGSDPDDDTNLSKLKGQMYILIKELIFIALIILGPELAGVYFRDMGFGVPKDEEDGVQSGRQQSATSVSMSPSSRRLNRMMGRHLNRLMNTPFGDDLTMSVCPTLPQHTEASALEGPYTYATYHTWVVERRLEELKTPVLSYPPFSIEEFLAHAPHGRTLASEDATLVAGWQARRETQAGADVKPAAEVVGQWRRRLESLTKGWWTETEHAVQSARHNIERGIMPQELVAQYARKVLNMWSEVAGTAFSFDQGSPVHNENISY